MEYREQLTTELKNKNPLTENNFMDKVQYERMIQSQVEELLQEMMYQPL